MLLSVVVFDNDDVQRAAKYLGMSEQDFINKYEVVKPGYINVTGGKCPLLSDENKCMVHAAKPKTCARRNPCEEKCQKLKKM